MTCLISQNNLLLRYSDSLENWSKTKIQSTRKGTCKMKESNQHEIYQDLSPNKKETEQSDSRQNIISGEFWYN